MNGTQRTGLWIAGGVGALVVAAYTSFLVTAITFLVETNGPDTTEGLCTHGVSGLGVVLVLGFVATQFWRGNSFIRWASVGALVVLGVGLIGLSAWLTTLDYPNATPENRVVMQADDRDRLPWRIAQGVGIAALGAMLLLPPVGRFVEYRRDQQAT
jgi:hypothetical protein